MLDGILFALCALGALVAVVAHLNGVLQRQRAEYCVRMAEEESREWQAYKRASIPQKGSPSK